MGQLTSWRARGSRRRRSGCARGGARLQHAQEHSQDAHQVGRYLWGSSPAGERVAAAGGGLAVLAAVPLREKKSLPIGRLLQDCNQCR